LTRFIALASMLLLALAVVAGSGGVPQASAATTCLPGRTSSWNARDDVLVGTPGRLHPRRAGNDTLDGGLGDDTLIGGA